MCAARRARDGAELPSRDDGPIRASRKRRLFLIERPVVRSQKGTRLCRPVERLKEIL
jgi:arsenate reductase-like glutaredoxin family protein